MKKINLFGSITFCDKTIVILNWDFRSNNKFSEVFIIEKSLNNKEFEIIGKIKKISTANRIFRYLFVDENITSENNYYRVSIKKAGATKKPNAISKTIAIKSINHKKNTDDLIIKNHQLVFNE